MIKNIVNKIKLKSILALFKHCKKVKIVTNVNCKLHTVKQLNLYLLKRKL